MQNLIRFMDMLCGTFENREQCHQEDADGERIHPGAKHVIGVSNEKMLNLPADFAGYFVIEESYFDMDDRTIAKHYLFLYEELKDGSIRLASYDPPPSVPRESLTNANQSLRIDFAEVKISPRFTPLVLEEDAGDFFGENVSQFAPETLFKFALRVTADALYVTELLERNRTRIAGFDTPIVYARAETQ